MYDAVEDRVGDGRIGKQAMPLGNGDLARDDGGRPLIVYGQLETDSLAIKNSPKWSLRIATVLALLGWSAGGL